MQLNFKEFEQHINRAAGFASVVRDESKVSHSVSLSSGTAVQLADTIDTLANDARKLATVAKDLIEENDSLSATKDRWSKANTELTEKIKSLENTIRQLNKKSTQGAVNG